MVYISISPVRRLLGAYDDSEVMFNAGLYNEGSYPVLDVAIRAWTDLDKFWAEAGKQKNEALFFKNQADFPSSKAQLRGQKKT
ncbi:hypothetical protein Q4578_20595, partial [Shimia thalassica]|nr:hypothetical protein [Shimia thalassica]